MDLPAQTYIEHSSEPILPDDDVVRRAYQTLDESCQFHGRCQAFAIVPSGGELTITGSVPSFYLKQVLQELLKRVDGVRSINNKVNVVAFDELSSVRDRREHANYSDVH